MCNFFLFLLCIFLPPLAVLIRRGCTIHLCINLFLCLLGYIPGILHGIYVCFYDNSPY